MFKKVINWFSKGDDLEFIPSLPKDATDKFFLKVDNIKIGALFCEDGEWYFKYTDDFKKCAEEYNYIVGFPDLNKTYKSETLWPFFQIRIPGLKQPSVQEILAKEKIDKDDEAALLKRFGRQTISNPYELIPA